MPVQLFLGWTNLTLLLYEMSSMKWPFILLSIPIEITNIYFLNFFHFLHLSSSFFFSMIVLHEYLHAHTLSYLSQQSNKVPVVQHAHHVHPLTPLITYSSEHFSPGTPPSHLSPEILDPKSGETDFIEPLFCDMTRTTATQACLGSTCRYPPHTSPIGALTLLPPVSWSCGLHCSPPGLVHATVSLTSSSNVVAVATLDWPLFIISYKKKKRI